MNGYHDFDTGDQLWTINLSHGYDEHSAWPIVAANHLWIASPFQGGCQLFRFDSNGQPERVWQSEVMSNDVASSVCVDGFIYGFDLREAQSKAHRPSRGEFRCLDFLSGQVRWSNGNAKRRRSLENDGELNREIGQASVLVADGKLIMLSDTGELILARADPTQCKILARMPVLSGQIGWASPALHRGGLFIRNHAQAVCVFLGKPNQLTTRASQNAVPLGELPQRSLHDWTSILGVEPEYAMDPPTRRWLYQWYQATVAVIVLAMMLALPVAFSAAAFSAVAFPVGGRREKQGSTATLTEQRKLGSWSRVVFWALAFVGCLVAGGIVSQLRNEFVFTWPGCLFISFHAATHQLAFSRKSPPPRGSRSTAIAFVVTCLVYFLICQRLSLVTQWVFLLGFVSALPFSLATRMVAERSGWVFRILEGILSLASFTAFYAGGVFALWIKYEIPAG